MYETDYSKRTTCLLLAGDPICQVHWHAAAASLGIAPFIAKPIADVLDGTDLPASCALIVVDLSGMAERDGDLLLHLVDRWCRDAGCPAVISFARKDIDRVAAAVETEHVMLLCEPDQTDRIVAVATALPLPQNRVAEIDTIANVLRLQQLADEVERIARALAQGSGDQRTTEGSVSDATRGYRSPPPAEVRVPVTAEYIRVILRLRRQREALFGTELFADPAWDMILDLTASRLERADVAISSLCIAAAVPPTTALRWIRTLTELRIFERRSDASDGRRIFVALADDAAARVIDFLGSAQATGALPL